MPLKRAAGKRARNASMSWAPRLSPEGSPATRTMCGAWALAGGDTVTCHFRACGLELRLAELLPDGHFNARGLRLPEVRNSIKGNSSAWSLTRACS